jgi:hypothetical protein
MLDRLARHAGLLRIAAPALVIAVVVATGLTRGLPTALLVLAAGALILVIALVWASVQSLTGQAPLTLEDAMSLAAPRAEEEQKRAVLRALKDLEYERSVGKITEEDYTELSARYRRQAKELLRSLDESLSPGRERVAALVEARLTGTEPAAERPKKRRKKSAATGDAARARPTRRCLSCEVKNELDARFCKGCGQSLAGEGEHACTACPARYPADRDACPDCGVARSDA